MSKPPARHAVFGHPIAHSLSPRIHAAFGEQLGIALTYAAIDATPDAFAAAVESFARDGGIGANVTLPHKQAVLALCAQVSARAARAGAVNTLVRVGDEWHGDTTDGPGLVRDLTERHGLTLRGRRVLLLGAGGAARGVAAALLVAGIGDMCIANRTRATADSLVETMRASGQLGACDLHRVAERGRFDVIINATSAARSSGMPVLASSLVDPHGACIDLGYGDAATPFLTWARAAGARRAIDGLGMLVEQAAESFSLWHGVRPDTKAVYALLRAEARR